MEFWRDKFLSLVSFTDLIKDELINFINLVCCLTVASQQSKWVARRKTNSALHSELLATLMEAKKNWFNIHWQVSETPMFSEEIPWSAWILLLQQ